MAFKNFKVETDADGIVLVTWDIPGRSMNVLDETSINELEEIVKQTSADAGVKGVVITSGKEALSAGADLSMLEGMNRRYKVGDVRQALACFAQSDIPYGISLMFGCPGETPETISQTLEVIDDYPVPPAGVWVSIGICLWTERQAVVEDASLAGQLKDNAEMFEGAHYISPDLPETYMLELIESLSSREGYTVQVNKAYADHQHLIGRDISDA